MIADALGVIGQCKIWRRDATRLGPCGPQPPYDLAFCDPPYDKGLGEKAVASLIAGDWLSSEAVVVLEESDRATIAGPPGLREIAKRVYGETQVIIYRYRPS
jgi:16S rRNA (guanine966-N2)-methyltransferase